MGVLAEQRKVRQRGNSGKWELMPVEEVETYE
jgi:hypothetical protein